MGNVIRIILALLVASFAGIGLHSLVSYFMEFPTTGTIRATKNAKTLGVTRVSLFSDLVTKVTPLVTPRIKFDKLARQEVEIALDAANKKDTPEVHLAKSVVIGVLGTMVGAIFCMGNVVLGLVVAFAAVAFAIIRYRIVFLSLKKLRKKIDREVPRFAATIAESIKTERDIVRVLTGYRVVAGDVFRKQLDRTIADMKSSNYESALLRFDYRINSPYLNDVIKGLLGALRGDDQTVYFSILCINLKVREKALLKEAANKRPAKMNRLSLVMLLSLIIIYAVVLGTVIIDSLGLFSFSGAVF